MEGWVSPGPRCKEQLAHNCYATAGGQRWARTHDLAAGGREHASHWTIASSLEMGDDIFTFESFIDFHEFFEIFQDPLFEIFIEILYFNYNLLIIRKNVSPSLTTAKGQWLEERRNDTYLYLVDYLLYKKFTPSLVPRPPGIPVREFPGIPGNPPLQKFPAGIPGNFWIFGEKFWQFTKFPSLVISCCELWNLADMKTHFSFFYEFKSLKLLDSRY